jgi:AraC-like DNA-binding protein
MLENVSLQFLLFCMLYGAGAAVAAVLCIYLLLRKGNAFVADITPPMRLRRWAAAFFAVAFLAHIWWFFFAYFSFDIHSAAYDVVYVLDCVALLTTVSGTLFAMLQDRRRPLWPVIVAMIPIVIIGGLQAVWPSIDFMPLSFVYISSFYVLFTIYMVKAVRQYGRWLRDNYADLEHKEVWLSHTLLIVLLLFFVMYGFTDDIVKSSIIHFFSFALYSLLLWRVETLPQLEVVANQEEDSLPESEGLPRLALAGEQVLGQAKQRSLSQSNIGQLLAERCVDTQLYLQHDLTVVQLAAAAGTNRSYLSQYFSSQGTTYNAYINNLRINHFISLYHEAVASQSPFTVHQLANDSGYRSYSTFSLAFKQRMGQSVTEWMRDTAV